jgi:hydrogenase maturation protein HypF
MIKRILISIRGAVQGVGFRPFIYRIAHELNLTGYVKNSSRGVTIEAEGEKEILQTFLLKIENEKPERSFINSLEFSYLDLKSYNGFIIGESEVFENGDTLILPDIAVCNDCVDELFDPANRRYHYPFINCTNCGPRYSIIESLPYDRCNTTMKYFAMCDQCRDEYENPFDRRFHAQPIACPRCGPRIKLLDKNLKEISSGYSALLLLAELLEFGKIIALKGLGGYQLIANAVKDEPVLQLRERKHRDRKPFALMFPDLISAENSAEISELEKRLLISPESPVVLLKKKKLAHNTFSDQVAPGNPYIGIMLPYTPLHHLLMRLINHPVIATSGNLSEEPMCIHEDEAFKRLGGIADYFLVHNRGIIRPVDDSVARLLNDGEMIIRRARGYAPLPVHLGFQSKASVIALGGQLKNTISVLKGDNVFVSQHIGDLENAETENVYRQTVNDITRIYNIEPDYVAHDLHPRYTTTRIAKSIGENTIAVQHHHAHAASCYYENQLHGTSLAVCWDGTGYGTDNTIWGGEFFLYDGNDFNRIAKLRDFRIQGNDKAVKEPLRPAAGVLYSMYFERAFNKIQFFPVKYDLEELKIQFQLLDQKINCFTTTSAGRLFDAVAYLLKICYKSGFEGEAAMNLEFLADENEKGTYPFEIRGIGTWIIDWHPMMKSILRDLCLNTDAKIISARFHNTLVKIISSVALMSKQKSVLLSGGCFQNIFLLNGVIRKLTEFGLNVYRNQRIPTNDGGISFGQAVIADNIISKKMEDNKCVLQSREKY